jgi:hypothetical protein
LLTNSAARSAAEQVADPASSSRSSIWRYEKATVSDHEDKHHHKGRADTGFQRLAETRVLTLMLSRGKVLIDFINPFPLCSWNQTRCYVRGFVSKWSYHGWKVYHHDMLFLILTAWLEPLER